MLVAVADTAAVVVPAAVVAVVVAVDNNFLVPFYHLLNFIFHILPRAFTPGKTEYGLVVFQYYPENPSCHIPN